ncbi:MAG: cysteine desulfurase [Candidatus Neomarinimicrobiota bacterium]|nr:MAG: cysteine desulfurase [Candidatus Neomarinimicrobiota bacterium]
MDETVLREMSTVQRDIFGNPSSTHAYGRKARHRVEKARAQVADLLQASPLEIIFTGGGSESNNQILWNLLYSRRKHVVTSAIEHPAILTTLKHLKNFGIRYTAVPVDRQGRVNPDEVRKAIEPDTGLITIMLANNEIGTVQPAEEIGRIAREAGIPFHTDAVQVPGKLPIDVRRLGVDALSLSAHKFYGPKGVGCLFLRQGFQPHAHILGGGQERRLRAGTENVPGIVGMGVAAELAREGYGPHLQALEARFRERLTSLCPEIRFNGDPDHHLPGLVSLTVPNPTTDILLIKLDRRGLAVSGGSACSSGSVQPSRVLQAIGLSNDQNQRTLRISFGKGNTLEEVDVLARALAEICGSGT